MDVKSILSIATAIKNVRVDAAYQVCTDYQFRTGLEATHYPNGKKNLKQNTTFFKLRQLRPTMK